MSIAEARSDARNDARNSERNAECQRLLDGLERLSLEEGEFHHRQHVQAAWALLEECDLSAALERFPRAIRRFARSVGASDLYHETITWLYLMLIHERRELLDQGHDWSTFAEHNADLLSDHRALLARFYSRATLESDLARRAFVLPDRLLVPVDAGGRAAATEAGSIR